MKIFGDISFDECFFRIQKIIAMLQKLKKRNFHEALILFYCLWFLKIEKFELRFY